MKSVLIVTHQRGFEADPVIDLLRSQKCEVFRFNTDQGDNASRASFFSHDGGIELECDQRRICSDEIGVGWCQQLPPYLGHPSNQTECLQNQSLWAQHSALFDLLKIPWLNQPSRVFNASNKILQLSFAKQCGLAIPETLVSNQPNRIREFRGLADQKSIVAKNLATPWIVSSNGATQAAFTRIVLDDWLKNETALSFCPIIYQTFHERRKDYRVVMVGEKSFVASCEPNDDQREDVRRAGATGEGYHACDFDSEIITRLKTLMRVMSLNYCAADFMEDPEANLYFLEVNTCGSWWWLDKIYDGAICEAISDFLLGYI